MRNLPFSSSYIEQKASNFQDNIFKENVRKTIFFFKNDIHLVSLSRNDNHPSLVKRMINQLAKDFL